MDEFNLAMDSKVQTNQVSNVRNVDRSFNVGKKLNDSFESERPI